MNEEDVSLKTPKRRAPKKDRDNSVLNDIHPVSTPERRDANNVKKDSLGGITTQGKTSGAVCPQEDNHPTSFDEVGIDSEKGDTKEELTSDEDNIAQLQIEYNRKNVIDLENKSSLQSQEDKTLSEGGHQNSNSDHSQTISREREEYGDQLEAHKAMFHEDTNEDCEENEDNYVEDGEPEHSQLEECMESPLQDSSSNISPNSIHKQEENDMQEAPSILDFKVYENMQQNVNPPFSCPLICTSKANIPHLYLLVVLSNQKIGQIGICFGDDERILADLFARHFQLESKSADFLANVIRYTIEKYIIEFQKKIQHEKGYHRVGASPSKLNSPSKSTAISTNDSPQKSFPTEQSKNENDSPRHHIAKLRSIPRSSENENKKLILVLMVKIEENQTEILPFYEGDDPVTAVNKFSKQFGLDASARISILNELLEKLPSSYQELNK